MRSVRACQVRVEVPLPHEALKAPSVSRYTHRWSHVNELR